MPASPALRRALLPLAALAVTAVFAAAMALTDYQLKDGDSRLYAKVAHALAAQGLGPAWITPEWPADYCKATGTTDHVGVFYGPTSPQLPCTPMTGVFRDHLAVFFWPAALLGVLGLAEVPALLTVNFVFCLLLLLLVFLLARDAAGEVAGHLAAWMWAFSAMGVQYLVRGNHEIPLALGALTAFWALRRVERSWGYTALLAAGVAGCLAIKGLVGLLVLPALALWWWVDGRSRRGATALVLSVPAVGLLALAYEAAFQSVTGTPFFSTYVGIQAGYSGERQGFSPLRKLGNLAYYLGTLAFGAAPWTLLWLERLRLRVRQGVRLDATARAVLATAALYAGFFSLFDRTAARYVFSVLPLLVVGVADVLPARLPRLRERLERHQAWWPFLLLGALLLLTAVRVYVHVRHHAFIQVGK